MRKGCAITKILWKNIETGGYEAAFCARRFRLDFWTENAMLDIGKFEKAFGNFLGAFLSVSAGKAYTAGGHKIVPFMRRK